MMSQKHVAFAQSLHKQIKINSDAAQMRINEKGENAPGKRRKYLQ